MDDKLQDVRYLGATGGGDIAQQPSASVGYGQVIPASVPTPAPPQPTPAAGAEPLRASSMDLLSAPASAQPSAQPGFTQTPVTPPVSTPGAPRGPRLHINWKKTLTFGGLALLALLIIGGLIAVFNTVVSKKAANQVASKFNTVALPLGEIASQSQDGLTLLGTRSLVINGPLRANDAFIISPSAQPSNATRGQVYYDQNQNILAYYNGQRFIPVASSETVVQSIGGARGNITLGQGLSGANGQISNSGVLSLQGQTGNVTLVAGPGVTIDGTTITNTGVTSFGGSTGDITIGSGLSLSGGELTNSGIISATGGTGISVVNDGSGNITISNTGAGTGTVQSPGGTIGRIAKFTGVQSIADSLLSESGTTVTVNGDLSVTGGLTLASALSVGNGGTGTTALANNGVVVGQGSGALTAVTAGGPGLCLLSTAGAPAFQACPGGASVTSVNGLTGALNVANATGSGTTITINDASTTQKGIAQFNNQNFTAASGIINTAQDIHVAATPTFGRLTLTSSQATSPMLLVNNTNGAGTGNLLDLQVGGVSRLAVSPAGAMTLSGTINGQTISSSANFTGTLAVTGAANLNGGATVAGTLTANTITPTGALTVGATGQSLTLQGNGSTTLSATNGANTSTLSFQTPTANVNYRLLTAAAGTYDICTTAGNCVGVGGSVSTSGGTTNQLAKFTGSNTIGSSIISDNGTTVSIAGALAVNTITPSGALTIGAIAQNLTLQGAATSITSTNGGITNSLSFATPSGSNKSIVVPNASGTVVVSASGPLAIDANGNITCPTCAVSGSGVTSLNGLTGALSIANATGAGSTITIQDASTTQKGLAQFNSTNFTAASGVVNTVQNINVAATPTFGALTLTSSQATSPMLLVNNTNGATTGNLIDLQLSGVSKLAVSPAGALTLAGTVNGQTISSSASFTGTLAVAGAASLNGGASVTGTLTANTITPTGTLTIGATNQAFTLQGNASSTFTATSGANTTTVAFQTPTANVTYRLLTAAAGTYDICTTVGNCAGVGGGVTTAGGTTGRVAKFTGSGSIGDSIISDNGSTVTIGGTLAVNTITPTGALTVGATSQNLALQGATTTLSATAAGITNTLAFATPSGANKTITLPNASGTVAVSASGPIVLDAAGNISCPTCALSGSGVTSLNGLTGALSIAGATGSGSTITIQDASTTQKGVAQFNSTNFSAASGVINTVQNINVAATPTFGALTLTSSQATSPMLLVNNTNAGATGNLIDLQLNGTSKLAVTPAGALTVAGTVNGQTISSAASFTGTLAVAGAASLNGGATVTGTLTANTITPTGAITIGATSQSVTLQGNASSTFTATSGANTTTLAFQTPTANVTYRLLTAAAGTYDICTTVGNCAGVGGGVTTSGGTTNKLAKFTGSQAIGDSIISDNGSTVTIGGVLAVNTITPTGALTIGATSQNLALQGATTSLSATATGITNTLTFATPSGSNKTITVPNASGTVAVSASGPITLDAAGNIACPTCALTGSGVTSLNGLTGALSIANATGSGSTVTIQDASTSQKGIAQFNSTNFSAASGTINTIQDISVSSAPTFGRLTVTSSQASNAMLLVNNTNAGATGNLLDLQLNGTSKLAVSPAGALTLAGTVNGQTISSAASFTGTLAVTGAANLNGGATVTGTLTANTITPTGSLAIGATNKDFLLQGNSSSTITATSGANTTTLAFQTPTANVTYRLLTNAAGTFDICTTAGNCAGVGGGVTTAGGTTNKLAKFTASSAIGDSIITDNGSTVTIGGTLAVNTITPGAAMTIGATTQNLTLQGATTNLVAVSGTGITTTLTFAAPSTSNKTITLPNASGTVAVSASGPLAIDANGNITCPTCVTSGGGSGGASAVDSLDGLTGALTLANSSGSGTTVTINDASTTQKGIAQFNSTNFSASSGTINTVQDINTSAAPTFGRLTVTSSQASNPMLLVNNTNAAGTGNLIDLQVSGVSKLAVTPAGAMTLVGTLNGQTISSAASFTGTLAVAGAASLNGGATVTGTLTANTITPTGALTVGATSQSFLVQGSSASTITATSGANTTTVAFQAPTANVTYRFLAAAAGTYDICTTVGNCAGVGGSVTTAGGTTGKLAKFTGSGSIGDSLVSESGSTVTVGGTLAVNTLTPTAALTVGASAQDLTLQGAVVNLKSTAAGVTNTLAFATPSGANKTITIPNASGTLVVSASGPLAIDAAGNITCATCATGTTVSSLNGLTGALSIANATGSGSTVTINDASTSQKGIAQFNSTNFSASAGTINTIQDINTTATPTFGRLTVTSSQASNPMLLVNNTNSSGTGNLIDLQLNGTSKLAVSPAGNLTLSGTVNGQTISSAASLTGTLAVAGAASLNGGATVTGTLTANTITPTGALTVGATSQSFLVQGSAASTITATSGANATTLAFQAATANVTYRFLTAAAGTYDVCTTVGNCAGVGGGVTTAGGTAGKLAKFTGSQTIADSLVSESGSTVTIGGTLAVNTLTPTAALTVGATGQDLTLQGAVVNLKSTATGITNALTFATPSGSNKTITIPNASGTLVVSATGPLAIDAAGNITCSTCVTSAVTSLNGLTGALSIANATGSGSTVTINDASTSQKGIAQFNSTNFTASAGVINTIQNINSTAAPTFGQLTLTSSQASAAMLTVNNTNVSATGNLIDLQLNGSSKLSVSPAGALTVAGTINGQTISSSASFTGTLAVTGAASLNGGATVTGTLTANTITPTSALTVGATTQSFLLQGNSSSTITSTSGLNTTTLAFQAPTANVTYRLLTAAAGTYDICTTVGNCAGVGGSVTTAGGTTGKIAKFTGSNAIGDSILSESGTTVTVAGTLAANTALQAPLLDTASAAALAIGTTNATAINLNQNTTIASGKTFTANGTVFFQPNSDSTTAFNMKASGGGNIFTVDTLNSRIGVNLGSNNLPATTLEVGGALRLSGTGVDTFASPAGANLPTKINIPVYDPGSFGQVLALGVNATAQSTARAVSLFDGRTFAHQPTLSVFSVDENNSVGLSWNGTSTTAYLTTLDHSSGGNTSDLVAQTGNVSGGAGSSGALYLQSGSIGGGTGFTTGSIYLQSGNGTGTNSSSGSVAIDVGAQTGSGTLGSISIGGINATTVQIGRISSIVNTNTNLHGLVVVRPNTDSLGSLKVTDSAGNQIFATGGAAGVVQTELGGTNVFTGRLAFDASGNGNTITVVGQNAPTANRTITLPDETGTICLQNSTNCGFALSSGSTAYIQNQNTVDQTGDFRISGTGRANTSITTPLLDSISGALNIGTTNATAINLQKSTTITGNLNQSTGTITLASNGNASLTATGLLTLTAGAASTWSTSAGNLTLQAATTNTLNLQTGGAGTVAVGDVNSTTINIGRGSDIARTINVGNTGGAQAITLNLGSSGGASTTTVNAGTGGLSFISGANVSIGTVDATGTLLVLDTKNTSGDPTGTNGGMYYNSNTGKFRCYENGAWANCVSGGTVTTLQTAYNGGNTILAADGTNLAFTFPDTTTDPSFVVNLQCTTCSSNGGRFAVQSNGTDAFKVNPNGQTEVDNNSSSAFKVVAASGGTATFNVDTSNNRVGIGTNTPQRTLDVNINDTLTNAPAVRVLQTGTGDASVELNNSANSFIFGIDTSDSSKFKISSSDANGGTINSGYTTPLYTNSPDSGNSALISATQVTSGGSGGTLNSVSVYLGNVPSGGHIKMGLYNDNGSNVPSTLIAGSGEVTAVANSWNTIPLTGTISASTKYWVGFRVDSNSTQYYYSTGGIASYANNAYASAWNNPFTQASTGGQPYAVYMTYTPSGSTDGFNGNLLSLTSTGALTLKNSTDSSDAFAVQNSTGVSVLTVDTSNNSNSTNLITNSGFESNTTGWAAKGSLAVFNTMKTNHHTGHSALFAEMSGSANTGVSYNVTLFDAVYYTASFYAKLGTGDTPTSTIVAGYSSDGTNDNTACQQTNPTVNSTGWTRFTCAFVTPASHSGTPYFYIKQTDASNRDLYIDDVVLQLDSNNLADPRNGAIDFQGPVSSPLTLQGLSNYSNAFNVMNANGATIFNVDTTDTGNLISNPSFEQSDTNWTNTASTAATEDPTQAYVGNWSLKVTTSAGANAGARYNIGSANSGANKLSTSTTYTLSWYAKLSSGTFTDIKGRYSRNGSSFVECTPTAQTVSTSGWTRFVCTFTTDATAPTGSAVIDIVQTAATGHVFWIDGVRLEQGSSARIYGNGALSYDAVFTSPFNIISTTPSTTAFTISNASNTNLMTVDTLNNTVSVGASSGSSSTIVQSGVGNVTLQTNSGSASIIAKSGTNSTSAFKVVNQSDTALVNVDTTNNILSFFNSATLGTWASAGVTTPSTTYRASAVTMNGYIYYLGGYNGTNAVTTTGYSKVYADGTISSFTTTTALPATRSSGAAVAGNGYVYYLGGYDNSNPTATVYYSKVNTDGTLGTWNTTTSLPSTATDGFYRTAATYANGYIYVMGGQNSSFTSQRSVYYAKVNADGTLGTWTAGTSLPTSNQRSLGTANVANGYIYYIDGADDTNVKNTVYFTTINPSTGAMGGAWTTATNLPTTGVRDGQSVVLNGYLYVMGGNTSINDGGSPTRTVSYTKLNPTTGQPGTWTDLTNSLPTGLYGASAVTVNGYLYYMGGTTNSNTGANYTNAVSYTSTPRVQVGGSLDLVGLQGGALSDVGDGANGSMGGSLTAGNTTIAGLLQVNGNANFRSGLSVLTSFNATGIINFTSAGGVSLFNIDASGVVRIGDATNNVSFDATNHEPTLNGNARHTRRISLSPEYPNVTMTPDSGCASCTGTMTSDNDIASPYHNYYNWNTTQATNQHYDIWVKVPIPSDFSAWSTTNPTIFAYGKTSNTTNGTIQIATYDSTGTQVQGLTAVTPGSTGTWVENSVNQSTGSFTYTPGGYLTLQIRLQAPQNGNTQLGEIRIDYLSKW